MNSIDYLNTGSADDFVDALLVEVETHRAITHPYLVRMRRGLFPDMKEALKDYAHQYSFYSRGFVSYLTSVIDRLPNDDHKEAIRENLEEEQGDPNSEKLEERPHVEIFNHFKKCVGADEAYCESTPPSSTVEIWSRLFQEKCDSDRLGIGLGAIGLATENIVPDIYPYIIEGIENHTDLGEDASLFFNLHVECDDGHGEDLVNVTKDIANDLTTREAIRFGAISALNLRAAFWDSQLARAFQM